MAQRTMPLKFLIEIYQVEGRLYTWLLNGPSTDHFSGLLHFSFKFLRVLI